jgi:H+/gluconate symporter-like permease
MNILTLVILALCVAVIGVIALGGEWANKNLNEANKAKPNKPSVKGKRANKGGQK